MLAKLAATPPPLPPVVPEASALASSAPLVPMGDANVCANCGQALTGPFCAQCGQHVKDFHRSVWRFLVDFFDNAFCWDNKLFLTLKPLLTRPGAITVDYLSGRRVRYVHPFRLFLFTSAICLTIIQSFGGSPVNVNFGDEGSSKKRHKTQVKLNVGDPSPSPTSSTATAGPMTPSGPATASPAATPTPEPSALPSATPLADRKSQRRKTADEDDVEEFPIKGLADEITRAVKENARQAGANPDGDTAAAQKAAATAANEQKIKNWVENVAEKKLGTPEARKRFQRDLTQGVQNRVSWVALALLPIFAMMLRGLYWRQDSYYFAHFVFSLHYHTALLLFGATYVLLQFILPTSLGLVRGLLHLSLLLPGVYLFLALRRMYAEPIKRTLAKVFLLGAMHLGTLVIGLAMVGALAAYRALG